MRVCGGTLTPCAPVVQCFEELVRRFAMQSRVEFQVVLFAGIASLSSRLHVHMVRACACVHSCTWIWEATISQTRR